MPTPLVSVLMPVYDAADTVDAALDGIAAQTIDDLEIVVVDDGSTDATPQRLRARRDPRLRVLRTEHAGLLPALMRGLAACRGHYVARMDADDECRPERLARQLELAEADPEIGVVGTQVEAFPADAVAAGFRLYVEWQNGLLSHDDICREIFVESPIAHPSALLRRRQLLQLGGYQERGWAEDYDLWLRYHAAGTRFAKVAEPLVRWREHAGRATRTDGRYTVDNFLRAKAHYLAAGPLRRCRDVVVWGAGRTGRRLSRHLRRAGRDVALFVDIAPARIGSTLHEAPIVAPEALAARWSRLQQPLLLAAVASRGARSLIRTQLDDGGWTEGVDYLCVA